MQWEDNLDKCIKKVKRQINRALPNLNGKKVLEVRFLLEIDAEEYHDLIDDQRESLEKMFKLGEDKC